MKKAFLLFLLILPSFVSAELYKHKGLYQVNIDGWFRNKVPNIGDIFTCSKCEHQIQIQVSFGPELSKDDDFKSNDEFISYFKDKEAQKAFAESILKKQIPKEMSIEITRTGISELGGLKLFQFQSLVEVVDVLSHDNSTIAVHKNRLFRISLNYLDGAMNDESRKWINSFYMSFKFL